MATHDSYTPGEIKWHVRNWAITGQQQGTSSTTADFVWDQWNSDTSGTADTATGGLGQALGGLGGGLLAGGLGNYALVTGQAQAHAVSNQERALAARPRSGAEIRALQEQQMLVQRTAQKAADRMMRQMMMQVNYQIMADGAIVYKTWIQDGLVDRITQLYQRNQVEINRIWQQMIAEELRLEKEEAERTAKAMLLDIIGEDQFKIYEETGNLLVKGRKYDYLITRQGSVKRVTKDKIINLCVHLKERHKYPETDNIIALAMHFKHHEWQSNRTANGRSGIPKGQLPKAANF